MNFAGIPSAEVDFYWHEALPLLTPAIERNGNHTAESILIGLKRADLQLWCAFEDGKMIMAGVTEIADYPKTRQCLLFLCGGERMDLWLEALPYVEQWALEQGCHKVRVDGRKGWARTLDGYRERGVVIEKDIANG